MGKAVLEQMLASAAGDSRIDPLTVPNDNANAVLRP